jgi:hypothetical protein
VKPSLKKIKIKIKNVMETPNTSQKTTAVFNIINHQRNAN